MKVFLVGYRCAGKSRLAALLAKLCRKNFCDLDCRIEEKTGSTIQEIVKKEGWDFFRFLEKECLLEVFEEEVAFVATGGGIVLQDENIRRMRDHGFVIYLKALPETVLSRMERDMAQGNMRPPLTEKFMEEEIRACMPERQPLYERAAHMTVKTDDSSPEELAREIVLRLQREGF